MKSVSKIATGLAYKNAPSLIYVMKTRFSAERKTFLLEYGLTVSEMISASQKDVNVKYQEMTDLFAPYGAKPHALKLRSNVQEELMKMDVRNTIHALKDLLETTTNSAQDIAQSNVIFNMNIFAPSHQQMDAPNHQLAKQRKLPMKENTVTNNIVN